MSMIPAIAPGEKPYWIIVSDEGAGTKPKHHETYQSAYEESIRLSKIKPGVKFNIYKYIGHSISTEPKTTFNTYQENWPSYYGSRGYEIPFRQSKWWY